MTKDECMPSFVIRPPSAKPGIYAQPSASSGATGGLFGTAAIVAANRPQASGCSFDARAVKPVLGECDRALPGH